MATSYPFAPGNPYATQGSPSYIDGATVAPLSAKNTNVRINGYVLFQSEWDVKPENGWQDTTNAEEGGYQNQSPCISKCDVTIQGWFNSGANMYDTPFSLKDGFYVPNVYLYLNGLTYNDATAPFWNFPWMSLKSPPMKVAVKDLVKYTLDLTSAGPFFYPTGIAPQIYGP